MEVKQQMENFRGIKIYPMTEFWLDCYSTAIFSIILSTCEVKPNFLYCNNYTYVSDSNERKKLERIYIKTDLKKEEAELLINKKEIYFSLEKDIAGTIEHIIDLNRILMLGIDMFYGVSDTSQWNKHHIRHYIIVEGYDKQQEVFYLLETGENGYKEYTMPYADLCIAAKNFEGPSFSYNINSEYRSRAYDIPTIKEKAKRIIDSIDNILPNINNLWHVESKFLMSMKDEVDTHLKSITNRQRVNKLLFQTMGYDKEPYGTQFEELEEEYRSLHRLFLETCKSTEYYNDERKIKGILERLLTKEKNIWKSFINE